MTTATKSVLEEQNAALMARIAELEANAKAKQRRITVKVSEKGAISMYGLQRFPVTLYVNQWERVIEHAAELQAFIIANRDQLSVKEN